MPSPESYRPEAAIPFLRADVTDFGQTLEALSGGRTLPGIEAVVHLAAIPSPAHATPDQVFRTNITSTHTVFSAAARLGLRRVVWASSETTLGLPFERPPDYAPVDEAHMYPETSYALSKVLGEEMARQFTAGAGCRSSACGSRTSWSAPTTSGSRPSGTTRTCASGTSGATSTRATSTQSVRLALEADIDGADNFIIAAADTVMKRPSRELMAEVFPGVPVADRVEGTTRCSTSARPGACSAMRRRSAGASCSGLAAGGVSRQPSGPSTCSLQPVVAERATRVDPTQ